MAVQDVPNPLVHRVTLNPGSEERKAKTKLDEILDERETRAAKRYSVAELEKMTLESENEVARLRGEPPKYKSYGGEELTEEEKKKQEEQRERLINAAKSLIDSGLDPRQVGQMLLGLPSTLTNYIPPPAQGQGMGVDDVLKIVNLVVGKKEADELKSLISSLDKRIEELAKGGVGRPEPRPIDPVTFAKQQAEAVAAWNKAIQELMPKSAVVSEKGEPLEVVKERNRHDEKMEEIKADRDYKQSITEIATEIPERIGRGLGGQFRGEGGSGPAAAGLEYIPCEDCGAKIYVTPETGDTVTCPKCGAKYQKGGTVESKIEGTEI